VVLAAVLKLRLHFPVGLSIARGEVRATLMLALPLMPATMLANSAAALIQFRAADLGEGAVAIYGYASRLHGALAQVLVIGLSTVLLPHFAALWSRGESGEVTILFRRLARCTILVAAYLMAGIYLMGESATKILFERGAFDAQQSQQVAWLWALLSLSLFPAAFGTFIAKFCQAVRGAGSILVSGIISFAACWIVTWFGASLGNLGIVTMAVVASAAFVTCFWLAWLARRVPVGPILGDIAIASLRIGFILVPAVAVERWSSTYTHGLPGAADLLVRGGLYSATVLALLMLTRSDRWFLARRPGVTA
jgi:putative peptidoglycan lipid II flippase